MQLRTTFAYAENTAMYLHPRYQRWNYLRVRGEYSKTVTP